MTEYGKGVHFNKIPYEMYDESLAREKVTKASEILSYLTKKYWDVSTGE